MRDTTWKVMTVVVTTTALAAGLLVAPAAHAYDMNGFMPAAGEGAVALSFSSESYDHFYRGETKVATPPFLGEVTTETVTLWGRYGLTDRIALVANLPYVDVEGDGRDRLGDSGIGDLTALVKIRLADFGGGNTLTGGLGIRSDVGGYQGDAPVSLGDASTDGLFRLVYQFQRGGFYVSQQVGYDLRGSDVPDGYPLYTELGYTFGRTTLNAFYSQYFADGGTDIGDAGFTFPSNREEYQRIGGKAYVRFAGGFGVSASAFTTLDGRNTGDSSGFSVGGVATF